MQLSALQKYNLQRHEKTCIPEQCLICKHNNINMKTHYKECFARYVKLVYVTVSDCDRIVKWKFEILILILPNFSFTFTGRLL